MERAEAKIREMSGKDEATSSIEETADSPGLRHRRGGKTEE